MASGRPGMGESSATVTCALKGCGVVFDANADDGYLIVSKAGASHLCSRGSLVRMGARRAQTAGDLIGDGCLSRPVTVAVGARVVPGHTSFRALTGGDE